ncbi:hypothetical protein RsTz2092_05790 [Deferribacterales bacterium RsTz2092]|nr:hypothetical protein AGMMS49941_05910 [Deferribacterales bacterium]
MNERNNKWLKKVDFLVGVPLLVIAWLYRRLTRPNRPKTQHKIAVIVLGAIGDTLLTSALINALKSNNKNFNIDIYNTLANKDAAELLSNVSNRYSYPLAKLPAMVAKLRTERYSIILDTTQWARVGAIITALSNAELTVGFKTAGQYRSLAYDVAVEHSNQKHEYENFLALGKAIFLDLYGKPVIKLPDAKQPLALPADLTNPYIICHQYPGGSNQPYKRWRADKWRELITTLTNTGYNIALTGAMTDRAECEEFVRNLSNNKVFSLAGKLSLRELARLIKDSFAVISVNTGVMHLAALLDVPTVGIHGPTNPRRWGAVGRRTATVLPQGAKTFLNLGFETLSSDDAFARYVSTQDVLDAFNELTCA